MAEQPPAGGPSEPQSPVPGPPGAGQFPVSGPHGVLPPKSGGWRMRLLGGGATVAAIAVVLFLKFGAKLFVAGVVVASLGGFFGGQWEKLPADQRQALEARLEAALGSTLDDLPEDQRTARLQQLVTDGAARLDDASLVLWEQIDTRALAGVDTATCATLSRVWFASAPDQAAVGKAWTAAYETLATEDFGRLAELDVAAIEAAVRASPPIRSVPDEAIDSVIGAMYDALPSASQAVFDRLAAGSTATDEEACELVRDLHAAVATLPADQMATWSVWASTP